MLKNKAKFVAIILTILMLLSTTFVYAKNEKKDDNETKTETVETTGKSAANEAEQSKTSEQDNMKKSDIYLMQDKVNIDYIIDGNLYVIANEVTIDSQINGDVFIMANNINITEKGYIYSNLFALAKDNININGIVYDVYAATKNFTLSSGYIYRDAKVSAENININGTIGRNAFFGCTNLNFNTVQGSSSAAIYGDLNYSARTEASIPDKTVNGKVNFKATSFEGPSTQQIILGYVMSALGFVVLVLVIWLLGLWLAPKFIEGSKEFIEKHPFKIFGIGILTLIILPIIALLLLILIATAQVGLLLCVLFVALWFIAKPIAIIAFNNYVCQQLKISKKLGVFGMLVVTSIIAYVLVNIPYAGWAFALVMFVDGMGIIVSSILPKRKKIDKNDDTVVETNKETE